jgi:hypothetical protein
MDHQNEQNLKELIRPDTNVLVAEPIKEKKKRGRKPKPKPEPSSCFKIIHGTVVISFDN